MLCPKKKRRLGVPVRLDLRFSVDVPSPPGLGPQRVGQHLDEETAIRRPAGSLAHLWHAGPYYVGRERGCPRLDPPRTIFPRWRGSRAHAACCELGQWSGTLGVGARRGVAAPLMLSCCVTVLTHACPDLTASELYGRVASDPDLT